VNNGNDTFALSDAANVSGTISGNRLAMCSTDLTSTGSPVRIASHKGVGSLRSNSLHRSTTSGSMPDRCTTRTRFVKASSTAMFEKDAPATCAPSSAKAVATSRGVTAADNAVANRQMSSSDRNGRTGIIF
jgi:hypothetical protein